MATQLEEILGRQIDSIKVLKDTIKSLQDQMANMDTSTEEWKTSTEQLAAAQKQLSDIMNAGKSKSVGAVQELRNSIKSMRDSLVDMDVSSQEYKDTCAKIYEEQTKLNTVMRAGKDANEAAADSLVGLEQQYKSLYNEYKAMSAAQRESVEGLAKMHELDDLSNKINDIKKSIGDYKNNVGRYTDSIIQAFDKMGGSASKLAGPLKIATGGVKGFNTALKANPIGFVIGLIQGLIAIVNKMKASIASNEEQQNRWNKAMAAFRPILDTTTNIINKMADGLVWLVEKAGNAVRWIQNLTKRGREMTKTYDSLVDSEQKLVKTKRDYQQLNAKDKEEVDSLRELASATQDREEKAKLLNEAKAKQEEIDNRNIEIAKEELRILEEQSKLTANDAAMNDKLAQAVARVSDAEATAARNARQFNQELKSTQTSSSSAGGAVKNLREEVKEMSKELTEYYKTDRQKTEEKYQKDYKLFVKYGQDTTLLTKKYNEDIRNIEDEERKKRLAALKTNAEAQAEMQREIAKQNGQSESQITSDILYKQATEWKEKIFPMWNKAWQKAIWLTKDEGLKLISDAVEEINAMGYNLVFPPKDADKALVTIIDEYDEYLYAYGNNIIDANNKFQKALSDTEKLAKMHADNIGDEFTMLLGGFPYEEYIQERLRNEREEMELEHEILRNRLENFEGTEEERLELQQRYYEVSQGLAEQEFALYERDHELMLQRRQDWYDFGDTVGSSINSVISSIYSLIQAEMQDGKTTREEFEKKKRTLKAFEGIMLAVSLAQIAASTASGIQGVWEAYSRELVLNAETAAAAGPAAAISKAALDAKSKASAILRTASIATAGAANMASAIAGTISKVSSLNAMEFGDGGGVGLAANVAPISSEPYTYSRVLQTQEEVDEMNKPVWASIVDIENAMGKQIKIREESSF